MELPDIFSVEQITPADGIYIFYVLFIKKKI